jgi:hypothetical protein
MSTKTRLLMMMLSLIVTACNLSTSGRPRFTTPTVPAGEDIPQIVSTPLPTLAATPTQLFAITLTPLFTSSRTATGFAGIGLPQPGASAIVFVATDQLQVRDNPGDQYGVVGVLQSFTQVEVLEGPQQVGAKSWWKIRFPGGEGWVAGLGEKPYQTLVPVTDFRFCTDAPLVTGGQADVFSLDGALSLFSAPTTTARVLTEMPIHTRVNVTGGAQSVGANVWYGVRYTDATGRAWDGFAVARSNDFCTLLPAG